MGVYVLVWQVCVYVVGVAMSGCVYEWVCMCGYRWACMSCVGVAGMSMSGCVCGRYRYCTLIGMGMAGTPTYTYKRATFLTCWFFSNMMLICICCLRMV